MPDVPGVANPGAAGTVPSVAEHLTAQIAQVRRDVETLQRQIAGAASAMGVTIDADGNVRRRSHNGGLFDGLFGG